MIKEWPCSQGHIAIINEGEFRGLESDLSSPVAFYYDEEQEITYINRDYLTDSSRIQLIQIVGFALRNDEDEEGRSDYYLEEVRYHEGDIFEERFSTIEDAFNRLDTYFQDSLYEWVTTASYSQVWSENQ